LSSPLPSMKQLDWEALLSPNVETFIERSMAMVKRTKIEPKLAECLTLTGDSVRNTACKKITQLFPNLYSVIEFLKDK
jgi:hypothetical protein